eukprot:scaffold1793_cov163-Alexandrium_tamarense.AAC.4
MDSSNASSPPNATRRITRKLSEPRHRARHNIPSSIVRPSRYSSDSLASLLSGGSDSYCTQEFDTSCASLVSEGKYELDESLESNRTRKPARRRKSESDLSMSSISERSWVAGVRFSKLMMMRNNTEIIVGKILH